MTSYRNTNTSGDANGYPGLVHLGRQVMDYIPHSNFYVEPFAGLGRTVKYATAPTVILNDMSDYAVNYLRKKYPQHRITQEDFVTCAKKWDGPNTVMMFDPPYRTETYKDNNLSYADRTDREYYLTLLNLCPTLKSRWLVCMDATRTGASVWASAPYYKTDIQSNKRYIFGKRAHIQLVANYPLIAKQTTLCI